MRVSKYMTQKLIVATSEMSVRQAFLTMRTHRVRHLPVVDGDTLAGIISDRDLRRPRWAEKIDDWTSYYQISDDITVKDVIEQPSTFWRRSLHEKLAPLKTDYYMAFDWDLWIRMRNSGAKVVTTDRVLSRYHFTWDNKCGRAGNRFGLRAPIRSCASSCRPPAGGPGRSRSSCGEGSSTTPGSTA